MTVQISKIGIVGTGVMGKQLTKYFVKRGYKITIIAKNSESVDYIQNIFSTLSERDSITVSNDYNDLNYCDIVIEAVVEDFSKKLESIIKIEESVQPSCIIVTNTSSISINGLAENLKNPIRFAGLHFFNPVEKMKLVEIVTGNSTSETTINFLNSFVFQNGKESVVVNDTPGFIVNRLLLPFINEAAHLVNQGITPETIDKSVKLGLNHPLGPLQLADLIGLDTCVSILYNISKQTSCEIKPPSKVLIDMVESGKLGKKTKEGFYKYT